MSRTLDLIWVKIREYFKHPVEDIRQAKPILPGRVYSNFGNLCKAVRYTKQELELINSSYEELPEELRLEAVNWEEFPTKCFVCDFQKKGIPCPFYNRLKDGRKVCDVYRYTIIKNS